MTGLLDLIEEARKAGVRLEVEGGKLLADPGGKLPEPLKTRIREHKPDLIRLLSASSRTDPDPVLAASAGRLQDADIRIAIWVTETDAGLQVTGERIVQGEAQARKAWQDGGIVFAPGEMLAYISMSPAERKLLRDVKSVRQNIPHGE